LSAAQRVAALRDVWRGLREIVGDLRAFLETDDYRFLVSAHERCESLSSISEAAELSGFRDLLENLRGMRGRIGVGGHSISTIEHGLLAQQAVYSIARANILATGIEFRLKRARGG